VSDYNIVLDDLSGPEVADLLRLHLSEMHRWSPACKIHALPLERLREPDVTFYSAWDGQALAAVGALKDLGGGRGEL
jgi:putative acetyltransferase